jgi:hypothetical protein
VRFVPKGTDNIPAMLTAGEVVLNAAQQKNLAGAIQSSRGGGTSIAISVDARGSNLYSPKAVDELAEKLADRLAESLPDVIMKGGKVKTKWQRAMRRRTG